MLGSVRVSPSTPTALARGTQRHHALSSVLWLETSIWLLDSNHDVHFFGVSSSPTNGRTLSSYVLERH